jgi:hypothetical protein
VGGGGGGGSLPFIKIDLNAATNLRGAMNLDRKAALYRCCAVAFGLFPGKGDI